MRSLTSRLSSLAVSLCTAAVVACISTQAQTFSVIHNFTGGIDGAQPVTGLIFDASGNLYGTAREGGYRGGNCSGTNGCGVIFTIPKHPVPGAPLLTPIYLFQGANDGANPFAQLIFGADGSLYGSTENGGGGPCGGFGALGCGTVFKLSRPLKAYDLWTEEVLYRFLGGYDGVDPFGHLVFDHEGNLYGTTQTGGSSRHCFPPGCGTVYELTPSGSNWTKKLLWSFGEGTDGIEPFGGVIFDRSGNLYGTTFTGGTSFQGVVFQLTPSGNMWKETILYNFQGGADGGLPYAGLVVDQSGNLFGAASNNGSGGGGTAFELTPSTFDWTFSVLYSFTQPKGAECGPFENLVMDHSGNLYGTTRCDGVNSAGSVFELTPAFGGWTYTSLHDFSGESDGAEPYGSLTLDGNGNLYGTTMTGGYYGHGVVFKITR